MNKKVVKKQVNISSRKNRMPSYKKRFPRGVPIRESEKNTHASKRNTGSPSDG